MTDNRNNPNTENMAAGNAEEIADALMAALATRQQRAERSVINSFAQQNHMSIADLTRLLEEKKARQPMIPDDVQAMIDERMRSADNRLVHAEIREIGGQLGLIDADAAFALMDKSGISVGDDGSVTGVREALGELIKAKPYLAGMNRPQGTGSTGNFPRNGSDSADYAMRLAEARRIGNNSLATAIISEAASKGVQLR